MARDGIAEHGQVFIRMGLHGVVATGLSVSQQKTAVKDGGLPKPIRLSERISGWSVEMLNDHYRELARAQAVVK